MRPESPSPPIPPDSPPLPPIPPGLYLVATPIGNIEDITLRALRLLAAADVLACEDTRVTRKLFQRYGIKAPGMIVAANDHTERAVAARLARLAAGGKVVVFCSDAGMPGISDPGFNLARAARDAGARVDVIPGPSAVTAAVALSGIPAASFTFLGFAPRRDGRLRRVLGEYGHLPAAMVFYESPRRLGRLFTLAAEELGPERPAAVCFELTKKFERVVRGRVAALAEKFTAEEPRGEAVAVIEGQGKGDGENEEDNADDEAGGSGLMADE